jgi:two-component system chemotaxis response regulator CheY
MPAVANADVIKRLDILIDDGRSYSRSLLRSMLLQLEVKKIHEVGDGLAALDAIGTFTPDVLIVDWDLPILNAREVLLAARHSGFLSSPDPPVIVLSSSGESAQVHEAKKFGVPHFMVWPISPKMLQDRLLEIVKAARRSARIYKRKGQSSVPAAASESQEPDLVEGRDGHAADRVIE